MNNKQALSLFFLGRNAMKYALDNDRKEVVELLKQTIEKK
jgi:isocitrate dehydrogenase